MRRQGKSLESGFDAMEQLKNEADLLCTLEHPCIVKVEFTFSRSQVGNLTLSDKGGGYNLSIKLDPPHIGVDDWRGLADKD